jgi:hypothetical protein
MLKSKSSIVLAFVLASASAAPAFATKLNGPDWLTMMQKIRANSDPSKQKDFVASGEFVNSQPGESCAAAQGRTCRHPAR